MFALLAPFASDCRTDAQPDATARAYVSFNASLIADAGLGRVVRLARELLLAEEAEVLMRTIREHKAKLSHLDSIDGLPSYELYILERAHSVHPAADTLTPLFARLERHVEATYGCAACRVCHCLLRRYLPTERTGVPSHYDRHAFVTAVVQLNPADFEGGLFLQRGARADSRAFFSAGPRDAILHQYDLNHGVDVTHGTRYSAIFWLADSAASCEEGTSPWYAADAEAGSVFAQDALMELHALGQHGYAKDFAAAVKWGTLAAEQGYAPSQARLGRLYLAGEGVQRDPRLGLEWVRRAAEQGYPSAEYTMGVACQYGDADGGLEAAARWFRSAAEAGEAKAQHELGLALANGDGVAVDRREGSLWLQKAAAQGHSEAKADLEQERT